MYYTDKNQIHLEKSVCSTFRTNLVKIHMETCQVEDCNFKILISSPSLAIYTEVSKYIPEHCMVLFPFHSFLFLLNFIYNNSPVLTTRVDFNKVYFKFSSQEQYLLNLFIFILFLPTRFSLSLLETAINHTSHS